MEAMTARQAYNLQHCELSLTSANLEEGLSISEWKSEFNKLIRSTECCLWWIGDLLSYGKRNYGEAYHKALAVGELTGYNVDTVRWAMVVAEKIPPVNRFTEISWSHHREVRDLSHDEQRKWLQAAIANEWTRTELRRALLEDARAIGDAPERRLAPLPIEAINRLKRDLTNLQGARPVEQWERNERAFYKSALKPIVEFWERL